MEWCMKYAVEITSDGMIYMSRFMETCLVILVILRLLPRQSERLQFCYYWWGGFIMHAVEVTSDCTILYRVQPLLCNSPINSDVAQFLSWQISENFPRQRIRTQHWNYYWKRCFQLGPSKVVIMKTWRDRHDLLSEAFSDRRLVYSANERLFNNIL